MGFDFGAFTSGFATGAAESIESRNKQIRNGATRQLDELVQQAEAKEKGLKTERDTLSQQARQLATFRGANNIGLTQSQILGLIQQPETAKALIEELKNKKDLSDVDFSTVFKISKPGTEMPVEDFITRKTSIAKDQQVKQPTQKVRGAFGLESPALGQVEREFEATTGRSAAEIRAIAAGKIDMGEDFKPTEGTIDFKQFGNPESLANVQNRLRDLIAAGEDLKSEKAKPLLAKLRADSVIKDMFKEPGDENKPRTTPAINSVIDKSLRAGLDPFVVKGVVRFDPALNDYVPVTGDAESIKNFMDHKNKLIQDQARALGIIDKDNNIVGGRNAADALLPYANIEGGKVVSFKSVVAPAVETPPATAPKVGGGTAPVISDKPLTIPKTSTGKIDGTKLVPGQTYTAADGTTKTWNGVSFQ